MQNAFKLSSQVSEACSKVENEGCSTRHSVPNKEHMRRPERALARDSGPIACELPTPEMEKFSGRYH